MLIVKTLAHRARWIGLTAWLALAPLSSVAIDGVYGCVLSTPFNTGTGGGPFAEPITLQFTPVVDLALIEIGALTTTAPSGSPAIDFYGIGNGFYVALKLGPAHLFSARTEFFYFPETASPSEFVGIALVDGPARVVAARGSVVTYCGNSIHCWQSDCTISGSRL